MKWHACGLRPSRLLFISAASATLLGAVEHASALTTIPSGSSTVNLQSLSPTETNFQVLPGSSVNAAGNAIQGDSSRSWTLDNQGTLSGTGIGVQLSSPSNLTNTGTITGSSGTAVSLLGGNSTLTLGASSILNGDVAGSGVNTTLILQGTGNEDSNFSGFTTITQQGTNWALGSVVIGNSPTSTLNLNVKNGSQLSIGLVGGTGSSSRMGLSGGGTLILKGNAPFNNSIQITSSTLSVGADINLGLSTNYVTLTDGSTLRLTDSFSFDHTLQTPPGTTNPINTVDTQANVVTFTKPVIGSGGLIKAGTGSMILAANNTYKRGTTIDAGTLQLGSGGTSGSVLGNLVNNSALVINRAGSVELNNDVIQDIGNAVTVTTPGNLTGAGTLTQASAGALSINRDQLYTGLSTVAAGSLLVNGSIPGAAQINPGATLGGSGTVGGAVAVANEGHLAPGTANPGTLTTGALTLGSTSNLDYTLELPEGSNDLTKVNGNLTLDGTLNLANVGGLSAGVYRLFDYTGTLTDNGLALGSNLPTRFSASDFLVQTSIPGQVNLIVSSGGYAVQFWDGINTTGNGAVDGGSGTWTNTPTNWTNVTGSVNAPWQGGYAVFRGTPGTVTLGENINVQGLQFLSGGYTVQGNGFSLAGEPQTFIRVATRGVATINAPIVDGAGGPATLNIGDAGLLVLNGANTYSGGTVVNGGFVQISSDSNLGAPSGKLTLNGADLLTSTSLTSPRSIELQTFGGVFSPAEGTTLTLSGPISGPGTLDKGGPATLVLGGNNSYGNTIVSGGTLIGSTTSLPGDIRNDATLVFDQGNDGTFNGNLSGFGTLTKQGAGELAFTGTSTQSGVTTVQNGALRVNGVMEGAVQVESGATFGGIGTVGTVAVASEGHLAPGTENPGTLTTQTLTLGNTSNLDYALELPEGSNDLTIVNGDLTLDGALNLANVGGLSAGVYRLFDYTGTLTDNGLALGSNLPTRFSASDFLVQTSIPGQVNLIVSGGGYAVQFWDGINTTGNGAVDGGSGTWTNTPTNWTNVTGSVNAPWQGGYAVFRGTPGTVTLGESINVQGLQFLSGGYTVQGNGFSLAGEPQTFIRVATRGVATINAPIVDGAGGPATLNIGDAGLLVLNGANTYSGGTVVNGGFVQISTDSNLGAPGGKLTLNGGELLTSASLTSPRSIELQTFGGVFSPAEGTTLTLSGPISGPGTLDKGGPGTLVLGGNNSYGNTIVSGGSLIGNTTSLPGDIRNDATLVFNQSNDGTFNGNLSGIGTLTKQGAGELAFTGTSTQSGVTTVQNGALRVDGEIQGPVAVSDAGVLRGTGRVGSTVNAGRVAPGNSIGTLNVDGDYTHQPGSVLEIEIAPDGRSDLLQVTGAAELQGGSVDVLPQPGPYPGPLRYLIVDTSTGVTGTFDGLSEQRAFFNVGLEYQPDQVYLRVQPLPFNNPNTCVSHNTCELTSALDAAAPGAGPGMTQLLQALAPLNESEINSTLNSLTGDLHPTMAAMALEGPALVGQSVTRRLSDLRGRFEGELSSAMMLTDSPLIAALDTNNQRLAEMAAAASSSQVPAASQGSWGRVYGVKGELDSDGNATGADSRLWGAVIGADRQLDENWVAGGSLNYSETRIDTDHNRDYGEVKAYDIAGYGSYTQGRDHLDMVVSYAYLDNDTRRDLNVGELSRTAKADYNGNRVSVFTEAGRRYDLSNEFIAHALASVQYTWLRQDGFTEHDADALGLSANAETTQSLRSALGGSLSKSYEVNGLHVLPQIRARWLYEFLDSYAQYDPAFIGAPDQTFNIRSAEVDRSSIALGAGVEMARRDGLTFFVDVDSRFNSDMRNYSLTGGLRYLW